ncbi:MAG: DUF4328 domain-containing protein [Ilumatobacteraceae bacterium]
MSDVSDFERPGGSPPPLPPLPPPGWGGPTGPTPSSGGPPPPPAYGGPGYAPAPPAYGQVPPGYVGYGQPGPGRLASTSGLRVAAIVLFWVVTAATVLLAVVAYGRGGAVRDATSQQDLDDANGAVGGMVALVAAVMLVAAIVTCIWSIRTTRNAKVRDPQNATSPGLAGSSWFIPLGNMVIPFQQLRSAAHSARAAQPLAIWQIGFIVAFACSIIQRVAIDDLNDGTLQDQIDKAHLQGFLLGGMALGFLVASIFAMGAMKAVDAATSGAEG